MGLVVDALASTIRDSVADADATLDEWLAALSQTYGQDANANGHLWLCEVDFGGSGVYGLHDTRETAIEAGKADAIPGSFVFVAPVRFCDESDPECIGYDNERDEFFAVLGGATSWREPERAIADPNQWVNSIPREIAGVILDREEPDSEEAAAWLKEHENDDAVWDVIGNAVDELIRLAKE